MRAAVLALALLLAAGSARAQAPSTSAADVGRHPIIERLADGWAWLTGHAGRAAGMVVPPSPSASAKSLAHADESVKLFKMLKEAGYKLKAISSGVSPVPGLQFKFGIVQELSEADLDHIERRLDQDKRLRPGLVAEMERAIILTALHINASELYVLEELKLQLLPYPKAEFTLAPREAPLPRNYDILLRAIEGRPPLSWRGAQSHVIR
ncbi:MAG: hypothetical protein OHK0024_21580 [Thalassobaculales bacterium]